MIKKIVCFILVFLTISAASLTALAASDNKETITLNVRIIKGENKEHKNIDLVKYKDEIYVSCSDIEKITRYKYAEGAFEDSAYYSLGDKSVNFFYEKGRVTMPNQNYEGTYGGAIEHNGSYYLHLASVMPWLNCECSFEGGRLCFTSDPITYFEITKQFRSLPSIYLGDYLKDGKNPYDILCGANALNNFLSMGKSLRQSFVVAANGNDPEYFNYDSYLKAFIEMASDDHISSKTASTVFKAFKYIKNINKLTKKIGIDFSKDDFSDDLAKFMIEYGIDESVQSSVYDVFDGMKAATIAATAADYVSPVAESVIAFEAAFNSLKGYDDALEQIVNSTPKKSVIHKAAEKAGDLIKAPYDYIKENYINYGIDKLIGAVTGGSAFFGAVDIAATFAKVAFPKEVKKVSEYSKITVLADICYSSADNAKSAPEAMSQKSRQHAESAMLLSALATKKTLESISKQESLLDKKKADINECIDDCTDFIVKLLLCEDLTEKDLKEKSDNDSSLTKGEEIVATFKDTIGEAVESPASSAPEGTLDNEEFEEVASDIDVDCIEYVDYKNDPYEIFFYWKNGKVGIMDKNGGIIEEARWDFLSHNEPYDQIFVFDNKLAAKFNGGSDFSIYPNGYWVKKNGTLTEDNYSGCGGPVETEELYWHEKDGKAYVFTVLLGQTINFTEYSYNAVSQSDWFDSFDSFRFIQPIDGVESNEDLSPRKTSEKYALFDIKTGKVISDYIYDDKYVINDRVALVEQDGVWRMIDYMGKYVNDCVYDDPHNTRCEEFDVGQRNAFVYCNGYIVTKSNGKFGLADEYGNQVIGHEYENISFVSADGIFGIQTDDGRWALFKKR